MSAGDRIVKKNEMNIKGLLYGRNIIFILNCSRNRTKIRKKHISDHHKKELAQLSKNKINLLVRN